MKEVNGECGIVRRERREIFAYRFAFVVYRFPLILTPYTLLLIPYSLYLTPYPFLQFFFLSGNYADIGLSVVHCCFV